MTVRKITIRTENTDDDTLVVKHSDRTGKVTVDANGSAVTLSPRQTEVLFNYFLRLKGTLDQANIPPAIPADAEDVMWDEAA